MIVARTSSTRPYGATPRPRKANTCYSLLMQTCGVTCSCSVGASEKLARRRCTAGSCELARRNRCAPLTSTTPSRMEWWPQSRSWSISILDGCCVRTQSGASWPSWHTAGFSLISSIIRDMIRGPTGTTRQGSRQLPCRVDARGQVTRATRPRRSVGRLGSARGCAWSRLGLGPRCLLKRQFPRLPEPQRLRLPPSIAHGHAQEDEFYA